MSNELPADLDTRSYNDTYVALLKALNVAFDLRMSHANIAVVLRDLAGDIERGDVARDPWGPNDSRGVVERPPASDAEAPPFTVERHEGFVEVHDSAHGEGVAVGYAEVPALIAALGEALAAKMTETFSLAAQDAVERMHAAGVSTVGVDKDRNIVSRAPDGTKTILGRADQPAAGDIQTAEDAWPDDRPFPIADALCAALVRGHWVRWSGSIEDFMRLPGRYELSRGYIHTTR